MKNSGELWPTNKKVWANIDTPGWTYSEHYILTLRRATPSNFYTHQRLTKAC